MFRRQYSAILFSYFGLFFACGLTPAVRQWNHTPEELISILGPHWDNERGVIDCPSMTPSQTVPTSVHALRPADISYIAAMGDSLTAANGAKANLIIFLLTEYRGVSWSIGGDTDLASTVTLANILRKFNPNLFGFSQGTGDRDSAKAFFNVAKAGAVSVDMVEQANLLVSRTKASLGVDKFNSTWKLVTFFIGGNDLCDVCVDPIKYSPQAYKNNVKQALDILHAQMPRTLVNFVTVLNVAELESLHEGVTCQTMQGFLCDCAVNQETIGEVFIANKAYQNATNELIDSGIYDTRDDFTVVRQPFMEHMTVPAKPDGKPDFSYFAPDCFHFSQKGHAAAAVELWNNMMEKVGQKTTSWNMLETLNCPTEPHGFIYTSKNSK